MPALLDLLDLAAGFWLDLMGAHSPISCMGVPVWTYPSTAGDFPLARTLAARAPIDFPDTRFSIQVAEAMTSR